MSTRSHSGLSTKSAKHLLIIAAISIILFYFTLQKEATDRPKVGDWSTEYVVVLVILTIFFHI